MLFHYAWHKPIATPTGLENSKHGLNPDRSGNSSHSEILLATTIHGFHQSLQLPERVPPHFPTLVPLEGEHAKPLQQMHLLSTESHHSILLIKNSFARSPMQCNSLSKNEQNCTTYVQFHMAKFCEYRITFRL